MPARPQSPKVRSAFGNVDLYADYKKVEAGFSGQPGNGKTANFVSNIILINS